MRNDGAKSAAVPIAVDSEAEGTSTSAKALPSQLMGSRREAAPCIDAADSGRHQLVRSDRHGAVGQQTVIECTWNGPRERRSGGEGKVRDDIYTSKGRDVSQQVGFAGNLHVDVIKDQSHGGESYTEMGRAWTAACWAGSSDGHRSGERAIHRRRWR